MKAITVFLGASHGNDPAYSECAREVGRSLAQRGITLVYGGGRVGLWVNSQMQRWQQVAR